MPYLKRNSQELLQLLLDGKYRPQLVRGVEIPKENGKTRKPGIPTVVHMAFEKCFEAVNQSNPIQDLSEMIKDERVISAIHRFLGAESW